LSFFKKLNLLNYVTFNDIRNAVFTIRGYLDLEKGLVKDTKMKDYLEKEETTVKKISRSLDFAKNYQDLGIMPPKWQNVNQIFLYAISHLDFSSLGRTVNLDNLEIYADPLLERVFLTLAENIIRHGKKATQVDISYQKTPDGLRIIFEDNGAGIPDDMKEKIFEREFGTRRGMGLFLAREILEITGITIKETGTFGKGARFELTVPREAFRFSEKDH
jgi:signal transduction histidine kinase